MKVKELRKAFSDFFVEQGHTHVSGSSLNPGSDPTLLFTNAGMNQFKSIFLGQAKAPYTRATSIQPCVRAGGKHNDLDNVGYTARHHTFFEMCGNFSFADYDKATAIGFAWTFLTDVLKVAQDRLWVTVYADDDEAHDIWTQQIGLADERVIRIATDDNFWSMGDVGPCGPCTEIFYDHGLAFEGGLPGTPEQDGDRYIEIWNLVFMQYNRQGDGSLEPLPALCVDTGLGLERMAAILQGVHDNYDIDLFQTLIQSTARVLSVKDLSNRSLRVIADHIRSCAFIIADGILPDNEGRGYVLRRIIRRAVRHGHQLGAKGPFFSKLVGTLVEEMGEAYPQLVKQQAFIEQTLKDEEVRFLRTLEQGMGLLEAQIQQLKGDTLPGDVIFKLYDTYGFPPDLTADVAREHNIICDEAGYAIALNAQRERSSGASRFKAAGAQFAHLQGSSDFTGYTTLSEEAKLEHVLNADGQKTTLSAGETGVLVLAHTPYYAQSGGQIGDQGMIVNDTARFLVADTQKQGALILHFGQVIDGGFKSGDTVKAQVDADKRSGTAAHHSATHLLHASLRNQLGEGVMQKGSWVGVDRLRFDFSYPQAMSHVQIVEVEAEVNGFIRANALVETELMAPKAAIEKGAMALFGEKYDTEVRVLSMGDFSMELCGGTHVKATGELGLFKIISETAVSAGVRRIEAVCSASALKWLNAMQARERQLSERLKSKPEQLLSRVEALQGQCKTQEKQVVRLQGELDKNQAGSVLDQVKSIDGVEVLCVTLAVDSPKALRERLDAFKAELPKAIIVLASVNAGRVSLVVGVSDALTHQFHAGELIKHIAEQVGGKGGGRADMAQAGGQNADALEGAMQSVYDWVKVRIATSERT